MTDLVKVRVIPMLPVPKTFDHPLKRAKFATFSAKELLGFVLRRIFEHYQQASANARRTRCSNKTVGSRICIDLTFA